MIKLLENYPFKNIGIKIVQGFNLEREHFGIDYILKKGDELASFEVYNMFEGSANFGVNNKLGKYFVLAKQYGNFLYKVVYAHLDNINENLQKYAIIQGDREFIIPAKYPLGWSAKAGVTFGIRKLHIEIQLTNLETGLKQKIDPYGIYGRQESVIYPQPGESLENFPHLWKTDEPEFI